MAYSINWVTAFKAVSSAPSAKASVFNNKSSTDSNSFKCNLAEAVRSRESTSSVKEYNPSRKSLKSSLNRLQENCKNSRKSQGYEVDDMEETVKDTDNTCSTLEEILLLLKQLSELQQAGSNAGEVQSDILEKIKTLLQQFNAQVAGTNNTETEGIMVNIKNIMDTISQLSNETTLKGSASDSSGIDALKESISDLLKMYNASHDKGQRAAGGTTGVKAQASTQAGEYNESPDEMQITEVIDGQKLQKVQDKAVSNEQHEAVGLENEENKIIQETAVQGNLEDEALQKPEEILSGEAGTEKKAAEKEDKNSKNSENNSLTGQGNSNTKFDMGKIAQDINPLEDTNSTRFDTYMDKTETGTVSMANNAERLQGAQKLDIINQIVKKAELIIREDQPEMRMQLEPENLGKLTLKVAVERGLVIAKFTAESYEVKEIIESNFNQLREMLQEKGIGVESFSVSVGNESKEFSNQRSSFYWGNSMKTPARISTSYDGYESYMQDGAGNIVTANPYSYHDGKFDHRA